jgi:hypothetical protein
MRRFIALRDPLKQETGRFLTFVTECFRGPRSSSTANVYIRSSGGHAEDEQASPQRWSIGYFESIPRCPKCPLKRQCRPSMPARWIVRDVKEAARDIARYKMQT